MIKVFIDDDIKGFKKVFLNQIKENNIHFGRYSLLSCLYLFNSKKILFFYEKTLIKNYNKPIKDLGYNAIIDEKFALLAKLNIKFYLTQKIINPIDILILKGHYKKAIKIQKSFNLQENTIIDELVKSNTQKVLIKDSKIIKQPLTLKQKIFYAVLSLCCFIFACGISLMAFDYIKTQSNLIFTYSDELSGYIVECGKFYNPQKIELSSTYEKKEVVAICGESFNNNLTTITIPSTVQQISKNSFVNCYNLEEINLIESSLIIEQLNLTVLQNNKTIIINNYYYANMYIEDTLFDSKLIKYDANYQLSIPQKNGYDFVGWFDSEFGNYSNSTNNSGESLSVFNKRVNTNFYAKFNTNEYKITLDFNSGAEFSYNDTYTIESEPIQIANPTREGYQFAGWQESDASAPALNLTIPTGTFGNLKFVAKWIPNLNAIKFDGNGATSGNMQDQTGYTNSAVILKPNQYQKAGYTFAGWATSADGGIMLSDGGLYIVGVLNQYTLYAKWTPNSNTIKFDGNGATSGSMQDQTGHTDSIVTLKSNQYQKAGYTFAGWATSADGDVEFANSSLYEIGTSNQYILYAKWTPNLNIIKFDGNGATSGTMADQTGYTNSTIILNENMYQKEGYSFVGWSTMIDGDIAFANKANFKVQTDNVVTLYAVWVKGNLYFVYKEQNFIDLIQSDYNQYDEIRLMNDLNFNNTEIPNFSYFTTIFNGNGYTISNIKLTDKCGLFDRTVDATIKNLGLENIELTNNLILTQSVGGLVGYSINSVVSECHTTGTINVNKYTGNDKDVRAEVGGLIGELGSYSNNTIRNCYSTCSIVAKVNYIVDAGGLVGSFVAGDSVSILIENCYATGNITAYSNPNKYDSRADAGAFIGDVNSYSGDFLATVTILNCFATGNTDAYANRYYAAGGFACSLSNVKLSLSNNYAMQGQKFYHNGEEKISYGVTYAEVLELAQILDFVMTAWSGNIWELSENKLPILKK